METILITGAGPNSVTGRTIKEYFVKRYQLHTPSSCELDLTDSDAVALFFKNNKIDYVIHCATFRPTSNKVEHFIDEELESNLRMYFSLAAQSSNFIKMIYFGSGAEYDKSRAIINASELKLGLSIPKDKYGFGKYIMNENCRRSSNIYNFRLFGTVNQYELYTKNVISNICAKVIMGLPVNLRQNCKFSFIDINDILPLLETSLKSEMRYHDYNLVHPNQLYLSEVVDIIYDIANKQGKTSFALEGNNLEYTGSGKRIEAEYPLSYTDLKKSISRVYYFLNSYKDCINIDIIDNRWCTRPLLLGQKSQTG